MFINSKDANSSTFQIEVTERDNRIIFAISDDGCGVASSVKERMLNDVVTNKDNGLGVSLLFSSNIVRKIGGELTYKGKGIDGKGVCFEISFLKEMPS